MRWSRQSTGMRPRLLALVMASAACRGDQQGYYAACDEPAGLVLDCPVDTHDDPSFSTWDACMKLAACGVILPQEEQEGAGPDTPPSFDRCVQEIELAHRDLGDVVLRCIRDATCADLSETLDDADDPNSQSDNIEGVIGWCGRLDPT